MATTRFYPPPNSRELEWKQAVDQVGVKDHFRDVTKMVSLGSGSEREIDDVLLTRYACYLIAQNGDPKKEEIAFAQSYFAVQTRKAELLPPAEDIKKVERRVAKEEKALEESQKLPRKK